MMLASQSLIVYTRLHFMCQALLPNVFDCEWVLGNNKGLLLRSGTAKALLPRAYKCS